MTRVIKILVHSPMSRERGGDYWSFAGWPRDGDMRRWEVNPRLSFMNLPRAFVSSTIEGPRLPKWHLKVTKSHFSCQSLFIEPQDKGQRGAGFLFFLSICSYAHYRTCLGLDPTLFNYNETCQTQIKRLKPLVHYIRFYYFIFTGHL